MENFFIYIESEFIRGKKLKNKIKFTRGTNKSMAATVFPSSFCRI